MRIVLAAATGKGESTLIFKADEIGPRTSNAYFAREAGDLVNLLEVVAPSGTIDNMLRIMLHREVLTYQEAGAYDKAEALMAAHAIFAERTGF